MGIPRRALLFGLATVMVLGIIVYFRLWIIDYQTSAGDTDLLRYKPTTLLFLIHTQIARYLSDIEQCEHLHAICLIFLQLFALLALIYWVLIFFSSLVCVND